METENGEPHVHHCVRWSRLDDPDHVQSLHPHRPAHRRRTRVVVVERIGGPLYPFVARMIPTLEANFEQVAADLKKAAEAAAS